MTVFGFHAVLDLIEKSGFIEGDRLIVARQVGQGSGGRDGRFQKVLRKAKLANVAVLQKGYGDLNALAGSKNHQGIILERAGELQLKSFTKQDFVAASGGIYLALDGVQDPQNLGAIVRTSVGLGVAGIFLPQKDSAPAGATAMKASAGTLGEMPLCFTGSIASLMQFVHDKNPDIAMLALDRSGDRLSQADQELAHGGRPFLLISGSEQGISRLVLERATHCRSLRISDGLESYNVSVAVALALYELTRE